VGREGQLAQLRRAYGRALERSQPVLVTLAGDPGVGKTRLVRELWEQLEEERPQPMRRTGRCLPYGQGITYWPLGEMLKEHHGIRDDDPSEAIRRRLGDREILGLTLALDVAGDLHPLAAQDRLHAAWIDFLSEQASQRPVVLLVEDVHWAEPPLLDLLERIARDATGPILLIATTRPDFVASRTGWGARADSESIWLEPLPEEASRVLVDSLLAADLPTDVRDLIVERAEGNPFFVEEVLGSLIDAGVLERANGRWSVHELPSGFEIPDSVHAVLAARIDLLPESEKTALQAAAVIGREFWTDPVYELLGDLQPDLRLLESRDFIRRRGSSSLEGEVEYVFKHALTREVAYGGLTKVRRAELHSKFAEWLEQLSEGRDEHASLLAHHYAEAVRPEDLDVVWPEGGPAFEHLRRNAVRWLRRAASGAISRYEVDDGIALLEQAADLEPDVGEQGRIWREIGQAQALRFDGEGFIAAMERSLDLSGEPRERAETYALLAFHSTTRSGMWPRRPTREVVDQWSLAALRGVEPDTRAQAHAWLARAMRDLSENAADKASELADRLNDPELQSHVLDARGTAAFHQGDFEAAYRWEKQRFDLIGEITDLDHLHDMHISSP
jgi:predicted ATPase